MSSCKEHGSTKDFQMESTLPLLRVLETTDNSVLPCNVCQGGWMSGDGKIFLLHEDKQGNEILAMALPGESQQKLSFQAGC